MERDPRPEDFIGKTIVAFDGSSWNIWRFSFSDGTAIAIEAENDFRCGAGLQVCDECAAPISGTNMVQYVGQDGEVHELPSDVLDRLGVG